MLKNLGKNIRSLRKAKGITLIEMGKKTGIAQATLSRIETGTMIGTVESHMLIAEVLGLSISELYEGLDRRIGEVTHWRRDSSGKLTHHTRDVQIELLTQESSRKKIAPYRMKFQAGGKTETQQEERGVEKFLLALKGDLKVVLAGQDYFLRENETLYFDASLPHCVINENSSPAEVFVAVSPPKI